MATKKYKFDLNDTNYTWDGKQWYETKTFVKPPSTVTSKLNVLVAKALEVEDDSVKDVDELTARAQAARDNQQFERSKALLDRVLALNPGHVGALAILCSVLRAQHAPERALEETEKFRNVKYAPLHVSRAAAMCDLGMWEEAKKEVGVALAVSRDHSAAFSVVDRIKAARPDLYEK
jgi:tetratricopeptide (TPR) repeat protein